MDLGLADRVALVTGARGGIGAAVARTLALEGCHVALLDRCRDAVLEDVAGAVEGVGRKALPLEADVRDFDAAGRVVDTVVERLGRLDILACSAGITRDGVSWKLGEAEWDEVLAVNLKGCFNYARAVAPVLRAEGGGRIVNIASINGLRGKLGQANYAASKAGVIGLSKTLARELGRFGVTVNVVAPGMVDTEMTRGLGAERLAAAAQESVLGRIALPEDVAHAVAFLCSERARHITGGVLRVDGGQYM